MINKVFFLMISLMSISNMFAQSASDSLIWEYFDKARWYRYGMHDYPKDPQKAFYWEKKAAECGLAISQAGVGICYEKGNGTSVNYEQAAYWFRKSADQGCSDGQWGLARCYKDGKGVPKDISKAIYWYTKAAEQDGGWIASDLGDIYYNGDGITKDYTKAIYWYKKGSNNTNVREKLKKFEWNGMYKVGNYGSYGLISSSCKQILPPEYNSLEYRDGYIYAKNNKGVALLSTDGQILLPASRGYSSLSILKNGETIHFIVSKGGRYGLIDRSGRVTVPVEMEALESAGSGYLKYKLNGFWGVMNYTGKIIIDTNRGYTSIGDFKTFNKRFAYTMTGYKGECDATGRQISKIKVATQTTPSSTTTTPSTTTTTTKPEEREPQRVIIEHQHTPQPMQEWQQCTSCWGSGNCRNCAGSGTTYIGSNLHRCTMCGGRGRCTTCSGQGGKYITVYR